MIDLLESNPDSVQRTLTIDDQIQLLKSMLPHADHEYLAYKVSKLNGDQELFETFAAELVDKRNFLTWQHCQKRKYLSEQRVKYLKELSLEEFLKEFPDPKSVSMTQIPCQFLENNNIEFKELFESLKCAWSDPTMCKVFDEITSQTSEEYVKWSLKVLVLIYGANHEPFISFVLSLNNYHFYPTYAIFETSFVFSQMKADKRKRMYEKCFEEIRQLKINDSRLLQELSYVYLEEQISSHFRDEKHKMSQIRAMTRRYGELRTCNCCYEEKFCSKEMYSCKNEEECHQFCMNCIRKFSEEQIGLNRVKICCIQTKCQEEYSVEVLENVLSRNVYNKLMQQREAQEIQDANIEDLETCPFCYFAAVIPNNEGVVFHCYAPDCLKTSCRLCRQPSHFPQTCEEFADQISQNKRIYMENEMSKAIIRECYECKKPFLQDDGCNFMRCICGEYMCYVCKQPIDGYFHFHEDASFESISGKCPMYTNRNDLHAKELKERAKQLKEELGSDAEFLYDPEANVPVKHGRRRQEQHRPDLREQFGLRHNGPDHQKDATIGRCLDTMHLYFQRAERALQGLRY